MNSPARRFSRVAPAIAATVLIAGAAFATPTVANAATITEPASGVALALAPAGDGIIAPGSDLVLTVEVANAGPGPVADGAIDIQLGDSPLTTATELGDWLDAPATDAAADTADAETDAPAAADSVADEFDLSTVISAPSTAVGSAASHTLQITVPAADLAFDDWGVYPLSATLSVEGTTVSTTRTTIVWNDGVTPSPAPAALTVIAPLTSVPSSTGLIQSAALEAFTGDSGILTRELDAVVDRPVTIAVDPRIIVSIRVLGSTAPESAVAWLERLDAASNPVIPLTFGDSDLAGQRQAGAEQVLQPTSFAYALDPANFTDVDELIEPSATPTSTPEPTDDATPTAEPTAVPPAIPTLEQLTDWNYATTSIAWPRTATVVADDLPFIAQAGFETTILDSVQVSLGDDPAGSEPLPAAGLVGDQKVLIADHGISTALQDTLSAVTDTRRGEAISQLTSALAIAAGAAEAADDPGPAVLAVLDRTAMNLTSVDEALSVIERTPWSSPAPLDSLLTSPAEQTVAIVDAPEAEERVQQITGLLADGRSIDAFSSVLSNPLLLSGEHRADLLALLSNAWTANPGGWNVAAQTSRDDTAVTLQSVQVVDGSSINMVANQANLPVTVSNELPYPVTVVLHVTPSNGRLVVEKSDVEVTIEAESRKGAQIPLEAGVANGPVVLNFQVLSPTGVLVSVPSPVVVNVSADWETWGTVIFAVLLVLLFGFGLVRNILRRRTTKREPVADGE